MLNKADMPSRMPYLQVLNTVQCICVLHDRHATYNGHHYVTMWDFVQAAWD